MKSPKKSPKKYECELCDYISSNKKDYNKHLSTRKHKNRTLLNEKSQKVPKNVNNYICDHCGKVYKVRNSYWYHIKKCNKEEEEEEINTNEPLKNIEINSTSSDNDKDYKRLIENMMDKNNELQNILIGQQQQYHKNLQELLPRIGNTTNNTKNEVNLNIFLNEDCKDALNMVEFIQSLQIKIENTIDSGYVNGISQIFIDGLRSLDLHKRPLHCSDPINEILYIKDNNVWEIDKDKHKIKNAIQCVNKKGAEQLHTLVNNGENDCENMISTFVLSDDKSNTTQHIIKNIVKEVIIK